MKTNNSKKIWKTNYEKNLKRQIWSKKQKLFPFFFSIRKNPFLGGFLSNFFVEAIFFGVSWWSFRISPLSVFLKYGQRAFNKTSGPRGAKTSSGQLSILSWGYSPMLRSLLEFKGVSTFTITLSLISHSTTVLSPWFMSITRIAV